MATLIRKGLLFAACALAACGDGLADRDYQGEPLLTVRGNVKGASDILPLEEPLLRLSAFWSPRGPRVKSVAELIEQPSITAQSSVPFSFTLKVFDTPQAQHYTNLPGGSRFALGTLLGYYDRNRNLRRDSDEPILANAHSILLYLPQTLSENLSPGGKALAAGYYQAASALACPPEPGGVPLPPDPVIAGSDCSAALGQACSSNSDCGRGVCIRELLAPWPGGGCVLPDPLPAGCGSTGITRITWAAEAEAGKPASPPVTYWVKRCSTDRDCGRSFPYQCDVAYGACLPTGLVLMNLSDSLPAPQFCR
ncbi:MAG TPA: hypothetical protein PKI03_07605 [Pseudomonadota bacterium]|nr:hypothetical protein [Pseudomonadota bacterium]